MLSTNGEVMVVVFCLLVCHQSLSGYMTPVGSEMVALSEMRRVSDDSLHLSSSSSFSALAAESLVDVFLSTCFLSTCTHKL